MAVRESTILRDFPYRGQSVEVNQRADSSFYVRLIGAPVVSGIPSHGPIKSLEERDLRKLMLAIDKLKAG